MIFNFFRRNGFSIAFVGILISGFFIFGLEYVLFDQKGASAEENENIAYIENIDTIGVVVRLYENIETKRNSDYFVETENENTYLISVEEKANKKMSHETIRVNENDKVLNEMRDKSFANYLQ